MDFQRARSPEQKAERRQAIVAAGARLLEGSAMDAVSLNAIAREARLAKSNLYRYFSTREEIFLALLAQDIEHWAVRAEHALGDLPDEPELEELAGALVNTLTSHPRMIRLLGQLVSVLERNASVEAIVEFKLKVKALAAQQASVVASKVSWMTEPMAHQLTFFQMALLQGLWPYHDPPPSVVEACRHPELHDMHQPLEASLRRAVEVLLRGLRAEAP